MLSGVQVELVAVVQAELITATTVFQARSIRAVAVAVAVATVLTVVQVAVDE
jgi:hypothetical protein